jgi:glycosyltransferase involved in cell wall biosynthesis
MMPKLVAGVEGVRVSVIVPVRNRSAKLVLCLEALGRQSYAAHQFEVLVVDNGSTDDIRSLCADRSNVIYVSEPRGGSYVARNAGLRRSRGSIVAFTDSDCVPAPEWLERGVARLERGDCDILGGRIEYLSANAQLNVYERLEEKIFKLDNQELFVSRNYAATANLLARRHVFDRAGTFDPGMNSLGDVEWGKRSCRLGFVLGYCAEAVVFHPRRSTHQDILMKVKRGAGGRQQLKLREKKYCSAFFDVIKDSPLSPRIVLFAFLISDRLNLSQRFAFALSLWHFSVVGTWERVKVICGRPAFRGD